MPHSRKSVIHTRSAEYKDKIIQLWRECFPGTPGERFDWLVEGNPAGPAEWFLAIDEDNGSIVGTATLTPKELFYNNKRFKGGIVGDLMVAPVARKQGVAQHIQQVIADSMEQLEMDFLYVVPNEKSRKLLVQAGLDQELQLKNYMLPVDPEHYVKKLGLKFPVKFLCNFLQKLGDAFFIQAGNDKQSSISVVSNFNEEVDTLWRTIKQTPNVLIGSRSSAYLNWKFGENPESDFQILHYRTSSGDLLGYIIFCVTDSKLHIFELVSTENQYIVGMIAELRKFAKINKVAGIYLCTTKSNPTLNVLWWRGLFPIGGHLQILCKGDIFMTNPRWAFYPSDRNI